MIVASRLGPQVGRLGVVRIPRGVPVTGEDPRPSDILDGMSYSPTLRWGDHSPGDVSEARGRLLDAAQRCLAGQEYHRVTMEAIAAEAKISRATLYRYFASRDEVLSGVVLREAARHLARILPRLEGEADLGAAILEMIHLTLKAAKRDPQIAIMFSSDESRYAGGILSESSVELFEMVADLLGRLDARHSGQLRQDVTVDDASEWVLRALLSLLTVRGPKRRSHAALDSYLRRFLLPALLADPADRSLGSGLADPVRTC